MDHIDVQGQAADLLVVGDGPGARLLVRAAAARGLDAGVVAPPLAGDDAAAGAGWPWPFAAPGVEPAGSSGLVAGGEASAGAASATTFARVRFGGGGLIVLGEAAAPLPLRPRWLALAPRARPLRPAWWQGPFAAPTHPTVRGTATRAPSRVLVLGGGRTGVEAAAAWADAGADTCLVEAAGRLLPDWAAALAARAAADLSARGVTVTCGWRAVAVRNGPSGTLVRLRHGGGQPDREEACDLAVPALGWRPVLAGLGLERTRVHLDRHGRAQTDGRLATAEPGLYALGAALAVPWPPRAVARQAGLVAGTLAGVAMPPTRHGLAVNVVRGAGPLLQAGLTAAAARARGHRAACARVEDGGAWVCCVRDGDSGTLLGVQAAGPGTETLAGPVDDLLGGGPDPTAAPVQVLPATPDPPLPPGRLPALLAAALAAAATQRDGEPDD